MDIGSMKGRIHVRAAAGLITIVGLALGCSNSSEPSDKRTTPPLSPFVVSSPVPAGSTALLSPGTAPHGTSLGSTIVYISLPPGAMPTGRTVSITNPHLGSSVSATFVDGGFDPVALTATAGDTLTLTVQTSNAGSVSYMRAVPGDGPPIVVRTSPPPHRRDVPLNARMVVVFSQPINPATLNTESVQLQHDRTPVPGEVAVGDPAHLTATFAPDAPLAALTDYELNVTQGVLGLDGAPLNARVAVPFTTAAAGTAPHFTVGGTVSGLVGSGLVLHNSGADPLTISANGPFTFATRIAGDAAYSVTVFAHPTNPAQTCAVSNGSGRVDVANVTTVAIACTTSPAAGLVFASVSVGGEHSCGVTTSGAAYCWGLNQEGGLGDGTTASSSTPVAVAGGLTFVSVSAGYLYTCGVSTADDLYCWGSNGIVPFPSDSARSSRPVALAPGLTFASVSAGYSHMCGVTTAGGAYCWGIGGYGELGSYHPGDIVPGGLTFAAVQAGDDNTTCGVTTNGAGYCWGSNTWGALGTGSTTGPELCNGANATTPNTYPCSHVPAAVAGGLTFVQVVDGSSHACGLTSSGSAYCWGWNYSGQLGNGTTTGPDMCYRSNPCTASPVPAGGGITFATITAGNGDTCGVTTTGAAYCWGAPYLGDGTTTGSATSVAVVGGLTFAALSIGGGRGGYSNTCGVTTGGVAYCWGENNYGQLGDGTTENSSIPVKVAGQP